MLTQDDIRECSKSQYEVPEYEELLHFKKDDVKKYCEWARSNYLKIIPKWDIDINTYWTAKYYLAIKFIYSAHLFTSALEQARMVNLKITVPYLIYYSLLTVSRSLIFTSPIDDRDIDYKRTHENIITTTTDILAKLNKDTANNYRNIISIAKEHRELFSYKFPASGLQLINDTSEEVYHNYRLIYELALLNSQILEELLTKKVDKKHFEVRGDMDSDLYKLFEYEGKIDSNDYYNAGYIGRKIKRPYSLNAMVSEGIQEDLYLSWAPEYESDELFTPPEFIF